MGFLRLLLAIAVVIDHSAPFLGMKLTGGRVAVQLFYMISGFYMALILSSKYTGRGGYRRFLASRALRLYPLYWTVVALTLCVSIGARAATGSWARLQPWVSCGEHLSPLTTAILASTNIVLFGQDAIMFTALSDGGRSLTWASDFTASTPPVYQFLLVPQAWSLGVELLFYLVAPFLLRQKTLVLVALVITSLMLRVWLALAFGLSHDPWTYRFFPSELALFVLGSLAFRVYASSDPEMTGRPLPGYAAIGIMSALIVVYPILATAVGEYAEALRWTLYAIFFMALPSIFRATRLSRTDNHIGELSYPIYICHVLVIWVLKSTVDHFELRNWLGELAVVASVAMAYALIQTVANPVERIRRSLTT